MQMKVFFAGLIFTIVSLSLFERGNAQSCPSGTTRSSLYRIHWGSGGNQYYYWCTVCGSHYYCGYRRGDANVYLSDNTPPGSAVVALYFREEGAECWSRATPWYFNGYHLGSTSGLGCGCRCYSCCYGRWIYAPPRSSGGQYLPLTGWKNRGSNTILLNNAQCVSHISIYTCYALDSCPLGRYRSGSSCIDCPAGRYRSSYSDNNCYDCPAGRYGATAGMSSSSCTAACPAGYWCPSGATSGTSNPCQAGRYSTGSATSSSCSGACAAGYYCESPATTATHKTCPGGRYSTGSAGNINQCYTCTAGYYCTAPSGSATENVCGGNKYYCPSGSSTALVAPSGTYTTGNDANRRTGYTSCPTGHYCVDGVAYQCPPGYFGSSTGLPSSTCSGQCAAGYYCPQGSTSSTQNRCGDYNVEPCKSKPYACYCPQGRGSPLTAPDKGYYTTPENGDPFLRSGLAACPSGYTCEFGQIVSNIRWSSGVCSSGFETRSLNEGQASVSLTPAFAVDNNGQFTPAFSLASVVASKNCNNPNPFSITSSGVLRTNSVPMNYEDCPEYTATIQVAAGRDLLKCEIIVKVIDENEPPTIVECGAREVEEKVAIQTLVGKPLEANDPDLGQALKWEITNSNIFDIGGCSGQIFVADAKLDYTQQQQYDLTIKVTDDGTPPISATCTVRVNILDKNDPPKAEDKTFTVPENAPGNHVVGNLKATDPDSDVLLYSIVRRDSIDAFTVNSNGDILVIANTLDFEVKNRYSLTIRVKEDRQKDPLHVDVNVDITISDANDPPRMAPTAVRSVAENSAEGVLVGAPITATDDDAGDVITFSVSPPGQFTVDPSTGQIKVAANAGLDYEGTPSMVISVLATDKQQSTSQTRVTINLQDVNEAPSFPTTSLSVPETTAIGVAFGLPLRADDPDAGQTVFYSFDPPTSKFTVDSVSGQVRVAGTLDFETVPSYTLSVKVQDNGSPSLSGTGTLTITVTDVDEPPMVPGTAMQVAENSNAGTYVGQVIAIDPEGSSVSYALIEGNEQGQFSIASDGKITVASSNSLDFEIYPYIDLKVEAKDTNGNAGTGICRVTLIDVNEPPVVISDAEPGQPMKRQVPELSPADTPVGSPVRATDPDKGQTLRFSLSNSNSHFKIDPNTGQILTAKTLPTITTFGKTTITVVVTDSHSTNPKSVSEPVEISLTDVNQAPYFDDSSYIRRVSEAATTGSSVGTPVIAKDDDPGHQSTLTYSIVSGNVGSTFSIAPTTGQITLQNKLDYETLSTYSLLIEVKDSPPDSNGKPVAPMSDLQTYTIEVLDANEPPIISDATFSVDENSPVDTKIGSPLANQASDPDNGDVLTYSITGGNPGSLFKITSTNGQLWVNKAGLNHESTPEYLVKIAATDKGGLSTVCTARIQIRNVNDNPVLLPISTVRVGEDLAIGSDVGPTFKATDEDGDSVVFDLKSGNSDGFFLLVGAQLKLAKALDFETKSSYTLEVRVTDAQGASDATTFVVDVWDVNEVPIFQGPASAAVDEHSNVGTQVFSTQATDVDAGDTLRYAISSGNTGDAFAIDAVTGIVTVKSSSALNYESQQLFKITISVTDSGNRVASGTVDVNIRDINDAPSIRTTSLAIAENSPVNSEVGTVVVFDEDVGQSHTLTLETNPSGIFGVDGLKITLLQSVLDYETKDKYTVRVRVTDNGSPAKSDVRDVTINVKDVNEPPVLNDAVVSVQENSAVSTAVGAALVATDPDFNQVLNYRIVAGDVDELFHIDTCSGQITVAKPLLNYEAKKQYVLTVVVQDDGIDPGPPRLSDMATVTVNIIDVNEAPTVVAASRTIDENSAVGTALPGGPVPATDPDNADNENIQTLSFAILPGSGSDAWSIDSSTGQISVANSELLDFENRPIWEVTIRVTDDYNPPLSTDVRYTINLNDVNEAPTLVSAKLEVRENSPAGTNVGAILGRDQDSGQTVSYSLIGGPHQSQFDVSPSGVVTVASGAVLDHETTDVMSIRVRLQDDASTPLHSDYDLDVTIIDVNEAPEINDATVRIDENSPIGTDASPALTSSDVDDGQQLLYSITSQSQSGVFRIDSVTGIIELRSTNLDFESLSSYQLTVKVTDSGSPPLSDTAVITVLVNDINEAPIVPKNQVVTVKENSPAGTHLSDGVKASDPDSGDTITYNIASGNVGNVFKIDANTGLVTVDRDALDFETAPVYNLQIKVTDAAGLSTTENFKVEIEDVNEAPMFAKSMFTMSVGEGAPAGWVIGPAVAVDVDAGTTLTWDITNVVPLVNYFTINQASGDIVVDVHQGKMALGNYLLDVKVSDQFGLSDTAQVMIEVVDQNEPPVIIVANLTVPENSIKGTVVGTVVATDPDTATRGDILSFALVDGNHNDAFQINPSSGVITVKTDVLKSGASNLDFESRSIYKLRITVTDDGVGFLSDSEIIHVILTDVPEKPVFTGGLVLSVPENSLSGTPVGTVLVSDVDEADIGKLRLSIVSGNEDNAFSISATTGIVTVNRPLLDTESKGSYSLKVRVVDSFNLATETWVTITVADENDRPVVRTATRTILENSVIGSLLGAPVSATDQDSKNVLTYSMGQSTCWAADAKTRDVWTWMPWELPSIKALPSGQKPFRLSFTLRAEVASTSAIISLAEARQNGLGASRYEIELGASQAPNNNGLVIRECSQVSSGSCTNLFMSASASLGDGLEVEGTSKEGSWRTIWVDLNDARVAVGMDSTTLASVSVSSLKDVKHVGMASSRGSVTFSSACFDSATLTARPFFAVAADGQLSVVQSPNAEAQSFYGFEIIAQDDGNGFLQGRGVVLVTVQDVNERPIWTTKRCSGSDFVDCFDVEENSAVGTSVGTITATEPDILTTQTVSYAITGGNTGESFSIDSVTGAITVAIGSLDHEGSSPVFTLTITATDTGSPSLSSIGYVRINIADVNEAPVLLDSIQEVDENVPLRTDVGQPLGGTDVDDPNFPWGILVYSILSGSPKFAIDPSTGQLYLTSGTLDHEDRDEYTLQVRVADAGGLFDDATITVRVIDINEPPTVFPAEIAIEENSVFPDPVGYPINATDPDEGQQLFFTLTGGDAMGVFRISACSGQVEVGSGAVLDYETKNAYWALVTVFDDGINPPRLSNTARINITIIDVNEPPIIKPATREVNENSPVGTVVGAPIPASDPDNGDVITYSLSFGNDKGIFTIDPVTGQISVAKNALDYEKEDERVWKLGVMVTDAKGLNTTAVTTVNVLDVNEAPVVEATPRLIHEFTPTSPLTAGDVVGSPIVARDPDAGHDATLKFEIVGGSSLFQIECCGTRKGQITVTSAAAKPGVLDFETKSSYPFTIRVTDVGGLSTDAVIVVQIVDVNEDPVIAAQVRSIPEDATKATAVGAPLVASDPENDKLTYEIINGNDKLLWTIEPLTGQLRVDTPALDYETISRHVITVRVSDSGKPSGSSLHKDAQVTINVIDVNEPPSCPPAAGMVFNIAENSAAGKIVGRLAATDVDAGDTAALTYTLTGGAGKPKFEVNPLTGDIMVATPTPELNFESPQKTLPLEITVKDPDDAFVVCNVQIVLEDVNEVPLLAFPPTLATPRRTAGIVGNSLESYTLDPDAADIRHNYRMIFPNNETRDTLELYADGDFTYIRVIDGETEYMTETPPFVFNVTIEVTDLGGLQSSAVAFIEITDRNFPPTISHSVLEVDENVAVGTVVGNLIGRDDNDPTQKLSYNITTRGANINNPFPFSVRNRPGGVNGAGIGEVFVSEAILDFESRWSEYLGAVTVTDNHETPMSFTASFNIRLRDKQEPPFFDSPTFTFSIPENSPAGTIVTTRVPAQDVDVADTGKLQYRILGDTSSVPFVLDPVTATLSVRTGANLDYEAKSSYTFEVEVKDSVAQTATASVTVDVADVNEPPVASISDLSVNENPTFPTVLGTINVVDQDTRDKHTFTLLDPLLSDYFQVGAVDGVISIAGVKTLDFEDKEQWTIPVRVTDSHPTNPLSTEINVKVTVKDVNDMTLEYVAMPEWVKEGVVPRSYPQVVIPTNASYSSGDAFKVVLIGTNMGPTLRKLEEQSRSPSSVSVKATYGGPNNDLYEASCQVVIPNTHIECSMAPGVGGDLQWQLTVNGWTVNGVDATKMTYRTPYIRSISAFGDRGDVTQRLDTLGKETVVLRGWDMGTVGADVDAWYGPDPANENYQAECEIQGHEEVRCISAAGVGKGHRWKVRIGRDGVSSLESMWSNATTSYNAPEVTLVRPLGLFETRGEGTIWLSGRYFGTKQYAGALRVTYGPGEGESKWLDRYVARNCVLRNDTFISCNPAPGIGTKHVWSVEVAQQVSTASATAGTTSYKPPVIRGIVDFPLAAITDGGQRFVLHGDQLPGASDPSGIIPTVWYGPAREGKVTKYQASNCTITNSYTHVSCQTAPGVGYNHSWVVEVDGQWSPVLHAGTGYAPPVILQYFDEGSADAFTRGDQPVRIEGKNFGPMSENAIDLVVYGGIEDEDEFVATGCQVSVDHTEVMCTTGPGAGRELSWTIMIAGQNSSMATTSYHPPEISAFMGPGSVDASSDGGQKVVIRGRYFGPGVEDGSSGVHFLDSVRYGVGSRVDYDVTDTCHVVDHETIECMTVPGLGSLMSWQVAVRDQLSDRVSFGTSYKAPEILSITPNGVETGSQQRALVQTVGGTPARILGRNLGALVEGVSAAVHVGTTKVLGVGPRIAPQVLYERRLTNNDVNPIAGRLLAPLEGELNRTMLDDGTYEVWRIISKRSTSGVLQPWLQRVQLLHEVTFEYPSGEGANVPLKIELSAKGAVEFTQAMPINYEPPMLAAVSTNETIPGVHILTLYGAYLTPGCVAYISDKRPKENNGNGKEQEEPEYVVSDGSNPDLTCTHSDDHSMMVCHYKHYYQRMKGYIHVRDVSGRRSASREYGTIPPLISARSDLLGSVFPTDGNYILMLEGEFKPSVDLSITVDGKYCQPLPNETHLINVLNPEREVTRVPYVPKPGVEEDPDGTEGTVRCSIPPGYHDGEIVVFNNDAGSPPIASDYLLPYVTSVEMEGSTDGGTLTIRGGNFGDWHEIERACSNTSYVNVADCDQASDCSSVFNNVTGITECHAKCRANDPTCAWVDAPAKPLGYVFLHYQGQRAVWPSFTGVTVLSWSHDKIVVELPQGEGRGFSVEVLVGLEMTNDRFAYPKSTSVPQHLKFAYPAPAISGLSLKTASGSPIADGLASTEGGDILMIEGSAFSKVYQNGEGFATPDLIFEGPDVLICGYPATRNEELGEATVQPGGHCKPCEVDPAKSSHTHIECKVPPGVGKDLTVHVDVKQQKNSDLSHRLSYRPPRLSAVTPDHADTGSQALVQLTGSDLGASNELVTVTFRRTDPSAVTSHIVAVNSSFNFATFNVPLGQGPVNYIAVEVGGQTSNEVLFRYNPPVFEAMVNSFGDDIVRQEVVWENGQNITKWVRNVDPLTGKKLYQGDCCVSEGGYTITLVGSSFGVDRVVYFSTPMLPSFDMVRNATTGHPRRANATHSTWQICKEKVNNAKTDPKYHQSITCEVPEGVGKDLTVWVLVSSGKDLQNTSDPLLFHYDPPEITFTNPLRPDARGETNLEFYGNNFGTLSLLREMIPAFHIDIAGKDCLDPAPTFVRGQTVLTCDTQNYTVGVKNVTLTVAFQTSFLSDNYTENQMRGIRTFFEMACSHGYYGVTDEYCSECPIGAICDDDETYNDPIALKGFFNLLTAGTHERCPFENRRRPLLLPTHTFDNNGEAIVQENEYFCPVVLPCEPPEACLGNNLCAPQYKQGSPRCSECAELHYRRDGECVPCPDNPWLLVVFFLVAAIGLGVLGYIMNRKNVHLAFLAIGVDYFQVLAIFANSKVQWPEALRSLFRLLSAFNINVDLAAPECALPNLDYATKWFFIEALPVAAVGLFFVCHVFIWFKTRFIMRQKKEANSHLPLLVGMSILVWFYYYLLATTTSLAVFNCQPTTPDDGNEYLAVAGVTEPCGEPGGLQMRLLPFAILTFSVYSIGFPVTMFIILWKKRHLVLEDQVLRAYGLGNTPQQNPNAFKLRRSMHKLYYLYRGEYYYWRIFVMGRKFCIVACSLLFRKNVVFQLAFIMLVLVISYALQVKYQPFMSMSQRHAVISNHEDQAKDPKSVHARIQTNIAGALADARRRRGRKDVWKAGLQKRQTAEFFFDYNTVESTLLFSAIIVTLSGVMFSSGQLERGNWEVQRDLITALVIILITASIIYFAVVFVSEVYVTCCPERAAKRQAKSSKIARRKSMSPDAMEPFDSPEASQQANPLAVSSSVNPLMTRRSMAPDAKDGSGQESMAESAANSVIKSAALPDSAEWQVVRSAYADLRDQVRALQKELAEKTANSPGMMMYRSNNKRLFDPTMAKSSTKHPFSSKSSKKGSK